MLRQTRLVAICNEISQSIPVFVCVLDGVLTCQRPLYFLEKADVSLQLFIHG